MNGKDVTVNFPQQSQWTGLVSEMELVPLPHDGATCNVCQVYTVYLFKYKLAQSNVPFNPKVMPQHGILFVLK